MAVIAVFKHDVKPGRMGDFMAKLKAAADHKFDSPVMPKSFRLFRSTVPGPDTGPVIMMIEYDDMAAYGARTAFENAHADWKRLFEAQPDSPENSALRGVTHRNVTQRTNRSSLGPPVLKPGVHPNEQAGCEDCIASRSACG
jgi:hypothetical protein